MVTVDTNTLTDARLLCGLQVATKFHFLWASEEKIKIGIWRKSARTKMKTKYIFLIIFPGRDFLRRLSFSHFPTSHFLTQSQEEWTRRTSRYSKNEDDEVSIRFIIASHFNYFG